MVGFFSGCSSCVSPADATNTYRTVFNRRPRKTRRGKTNKEEHSTSTCKTLLQRLAFPQTSPLFIVKCTYYKAVSTIRFTHVRTRSPPRPISRARARARARLKLAAKYNSRPYRHYRRFSTQLDPAACNK